MTRDALFRGRVTYRQPARGEGYRVNVDALLLAAFASEGRRAALAVDLGAGAGAIGLALLHADAAARVALVEIDPAAADAAEANLADNAWASRGRVARCDVRALPADLLAAGDLVVCNPPYVEPGAGRLPAGSARALARAGAIEHFTRAARAALGRRARACFVYPARASVALLRALEEAGLFAKRLRAVHADAGCPARIVMVEACAGKPGGLVVATPLFERDASGYTPELAAVLAGEVRRAPAGTLRPRLPVARAAR